MGNMAHEMTYQKHGTQNDVKVGVNQPWPEVPNEIWCQKNH